MFKKILLLLFLCFFTLSPLLVAAAETSSLADKLKGRILLQVEAKGEAWYINPESRKRFFLGRPTDAYRLMRRHGLGITSAKLAQIPIALMDLPGVPDSDGDRLPDTFEDAIGTSKDKRDSDADSYDDYTELRGGFDPRSRNRLVIDTNLVSRLSGRILLQVESRGEAWYLNPADGKRYFLGRAADAFAVMNKLGLGVKNQDLEKISIGKDSLSLGPELLLRDELVRSVDSSGKRSLNMMSENPLSNGTQAAWIEQEFSLYKENVDLKSLPDNERSLSSNRFDFGDAGLEYYKSQGDRVYLRDLEDMSKTKLIQRQRRVVDLALSETHLAWIEYDERIECPDPKVSDYDPNTDKCFPEEDDTANIVQYNWEIFYYDIRSGTLLSFFPESKQRIKDMRLGRNWLVFRDEQSGDSPKAGHAYEAGALYVYDLGSLKEQKVCNSDCREPAVSGQNLAWINKGNVYHFDLEKKETQQLNNDAHVRTSLSISDKYVAWLDYGTELKNFTGFGIAQGVEYYSLEQRQIKKLPLMEDGRNFIQVRAQLSGSDILYQAGNAEYLYDIDNNQTLRLGDTSYDSFLSGNILIYNINDKRSTLTYYRLIR